MDTESAFDQVVGDTDYAMYVITAADGEERAGCLVGFTTQCSIRPPRFLVCLSKANRTYRLACRAPALGVHLLRQDQRELASLFGEMTGDEADKFRPVPLGSRAGGCPASVRLRQLVRGQCPRSLRPRRSRKVSARTDTRREAQRGHPAHVSIRARPGAGPPGRGGMIASRSLFQEF